MIRLAVFDVDGTLFSHKTLEVPKSAVEAIKSLQEDGILIAIASGRPSYAMQNVQNVGIQPDYVLGCNGHAIGKGYHEIMDGFYFRKEIVDELTEFCLKHDYALTWKFSDKNYVYNGFDEIHAMEKRLCIPPDVTCDCFDRKHHEEELPFGAVIYAPQEEVDAYAKKHNEIVFLPFAKNKFDVSLAHVNKAVGLKKLLEDMDITLDECIAFGDGLNDVEMIEEAGLGVAMKECHPALLKVCDYQTDDCLEDGIAKALLYYQLIDEIKN